MQKHFSYSSDKQIWRLLISDFDKLIIENRDASTKEVFYQCIDLVTGHNVFSDIQLEEKNWIGIETVYKDIIYFHLFPKRDLPEHKGIIALDIVTQKVLWQNLDKTFLFLGNEKIYSFIQGFEDRSFYSHDHLSGELIDDLGNNYTLLNSLREEAESKKDWNKYIYPEVILDEENEFLKIINIETDKYLLAGEIEKAVYNKLLIYSFHSKEDDSTFTNRFTIVDLSNGRTVLNIILNKKVSSLLTDSFFIYKNYLVVLVGKNEIEVYDLEKV